MVQDEEQQNQNQGQGWYGDPEGHARAGKEGGEATLEKHGPGFYEEIGKEGGKVSPGNFKNDPQRASEAGRKGGQSRGDNQD